MKKQLFLIFGILFIGYCQSISQPQWKFHLAFEDATGAKDTIWFIWDTTASFYNVDTLLGEGNPHMDYTKFNVYTFIWDTENDYDTSKVVANPYNYSFESELKAINFVLPIKISWDSSLFHADWLPSEPVGWVNYAWIGNDYFFFVNNTEEHYFDLTKDDHTITPDSTIVGTEDEDPWFWLPERNFPLGVGLAQDPTLFVNENLTIKDYFIYPNPVHSLLTVDTREEISTIKIFNMQGKCLHIINTRAIPFNIDFSGFNPGIYIIQLISNQNQYYREKVIKAH